MGSSLLESESTVRKTIKKSFLQDEASYKTGCHDPLENRFEEQGARCPDL